MGFHCAPARRPEVTPRNAIIRPHPSIELGNDQSVSSSPKCRVPNAVEKTGEAGHAEPSTREGDRTRYRERHPPEGRT
jgi:hypothetical protein